MRFSNKTHIFRITKPLFNLYILGSKLLNCKFKLLLFLAWALSFNASSQSKLDSLTLAFDSAIEPIDKFETQTEIAYYYYKNHSFDTALTKYTVAYQMVPEGDFENKGKAVVRIANVYQAQEDLQNSLIHFKMAQNIFSQNQCEPSLEADVLRDIGRTYYGQSKYDSAMVYYMKSKNIYEVNHIENESYGYLLHYIGSVFKRQDNMAKACEYYEMEKTTVKTITSHEFMPMVSIYPQIVLRAIEKEFTMTWPLLNSTKI